MTKTRLSADASMVQKKFYAGSRELDPAEKVSMAFGRELAKDKVCVNVVASFAHMRNWAY